MAWPALSAMVAVYPLRVSNAETISRTGASSSTIKILSCGIDTLSLVVLLFSFRMRSPEFYRLAGKFREWDGIECCGWLIRSFIA
jgi:hypothetical protein